MTDSLFNAELRDCARVNETLSMREQHDRAMQVAKLAAETRTAEETAMYQRAISRDEQAHQNACDQGHDWDDYDPVDLYGAEWDNHAVREWD